MSTREPKVKIFYSYSHKDEELREQFEAHMSSLKRTGYIEEWHDRKILPGQTWKTSIYSNMEESDIVLFLVSSDFLNSDYCYNKEVLKSVERHNQGKCTVVPILVRDCDYEGTPFESIQGLPTDMKPIISRHWHNIDEAFVNVARGLKKIIKQKHQEKSHGHKANFNKTKSNAEVEFIIRNLINGDEVTMETSTMVTVKELLDELKRAELIDKKNTFQIVRKRDGLLFKESSTLQDHNVQNDDVLLLTLQTFAG